MRITHVSHGRVVLCFSLQNFWSKGLGPVLLSLWQCFVNTSVVIYALFRFERILVTKSLSHSTVGSSVDCPTLAQLRTGGCKLRLWWEKEIFTGIIDFLQNEENWAEPTLAIQMQRYRAQVTANLWWSDAFLVSLLSKQKDIQKSNTRGNTLRSVIIESEVRIRCLI